jgi:hypothetical protein
MHCHTYLSNSLYRLKAILIPSVLFILVFLVACPDAPFFKDEEEPDTLSLTGTVTDANSGLPIADATVQIFYMGGAEGGMNVLKSTKTDQEGLYYMVYQGSAFFLEPSPSGQGLLRRLWLKATAGGYQLQLSEIHDTELLQTIDFQLPPIT